MPSRGALQARYARGRELVGKALHQVELRCAELDGELVQRALNACEEPAHELANVMGTWVLDVARPDEELAGVLARYATALNAALDHELAAAHGCVDLFGKPIQPHR